MMKTGVLVGLHDIRANLERVKSYGFAKRFYDRYDVAELRRANRLTKEQIAEDVITILS